MTRTFRARNGVWVPYRSKQTKHIKKELRFLTSHRYSPSQGREIKALRHRLSVPLHCLGDQLIAAGHYHLQKMVTDAFRFIRDCMAFERLVLRQTCVVSANQSDGDRDDSTCMSSVHTHTIRPLWEKKHLTCDLFSARRNAHRTIPKKGGCVGTRQCACKHAHN